MPLAPPSPFQNFAQFPCCIALRALVEQHSRVLKGRLRGGKWQRRLRRSLQRLRCTKRIVECPVERGFHHALVGLHSNDAFQLRKIRALGLQVQRHNVQGRVLDRRHDQFPANHSRPEVAADSRPPQRLFADSASPSGGTNDLRFRVSPNSAVALAAPVKRAEKAFAGEQPELYLSDEQPGEAAPYERLPGDAMAGDAALFARADSVEAAWTLADPVLKSHRPVRPYRGHS